MSEHTPVHVAIIDYHTSNLFSVKHACDHVGLETEITSDRHTIAGADAAILPGVGAFGDAMRKLTKLDLIAPIKDFIASDKPFMGICLGLQLLFTESVEFGSTLGLNVVEGQVIKFPNEAPGGDKIKVPHMGWNQIVHPQSEACAWGGSPLRHIAQGEYMYFVHSFYVVPEDKGTILCATQYQGVSFCSGVLKGNIFATQFHPEKSAREGIKVYSDWVGLMKKMRNCDE